jgi:hypothetical protein
MRNAIILASVLALGACGGAFAETRDDGPAVQRGFNVGGFNSVALGGAHNVVVTVGGAPSVRAVGPAAALDRLDIRVENGALRIGSKREDHWNFGFRHDRPRVTIYVTVPALASASIGGSGDMRIDKVEGERFSAQIGGSGDMQIGQLRVGEAAFSVAGSGDVKAAGAAQRTQISIAGSGDVDLPNLESRRASISVVGSGDVRARVMEAADVSVMGSGDVIIGGGAKCSIHKMGSGDVRCGG